MEGAPSDQGSSSGLSLGQQWVYMFCDISSGWGRAAGWKQSRLVTPAGVSDLAPESSCSPVREG